MVFSGFQRFSTRLLTLAGLVLVLGCLALLRYQEFFVDTVYGKFDRYIRNIVL